MKKKVVWMSALLAAALLLSACAPQNAPTAAPAAPAAAADAAEAAPQPEAQKAEYRSISAADAKARMDSGDPLLILDVRTQAEYDEGHIPGAVLLPNERIGQERPELLADLHQEILLYCRSGNRSRQAANKLVALGYTNVHDFGGIINWPYDVVKEGK